jgi:hypothetical protein
MSIPQITRDHAEANRNGVLLPVLRGESAVIGPDLTLIDRADGQVELYRMSNDHGALVGTFSSIGEIWQVVDEIDTARASAA